MMVLEFCESEDLDQLRTRITHTDRTHFMLSCLFGFSSGVCLTLSRLGVVQLRFVTRVGVSPNSTRVGKVA
jgi:hypothetical protein